MGARTITPERSARQRASSPPRVPNHGQVRVAIGDGFPLLVVGLVEMLRQHASDFEIVGFACSGAELERLVRAQRPTVTVVGDHLPCLAEVPFPTLVKRCARHTLAVVLGSHPAEPASSGPESDAGCSDKGVAIVRPQGAVGYVLRHAELEDLVAVIRLASRGYKAYPSGMG